ncbi:unnamed protein product [Ectocarpus sp. 12 AP-2014]
MIKARDTSRRAPSGVLWLAAVVSAACCVQSENMGKESVTERRETLLLLNKKVVWLHAFSLSYVRGKRPPLLLFLSYFDRSPRALFSTGRCETTTTTNSTQRHECNNSSSCTRTCVLAFTVPTPCVGTAAAAGVAAHLTVAAIPAGCFVSRCVAKRSDSPVTQCAPLSRQQLAAKLNCPLRDLRMADPTFPGQFPSVLARRGSIIFSVGEVKAVILSNEVLLFPTKPDVLSIVPAVQEKIRLGIKAVPFEQTVIECCLKHVCKDLLESARNVEPRLRTVLDSFKTSKNSLIKSLHRLLPLKNELDELKETLVTVCKCMNEVLMNDEDMALMYLTDNECKSTARDLHQHQEIEMLFENYLLQVELLASDVKELQNEVRNTEEIVEIELDVLRNNILRFELLLSISGFTVALGALVTGVFGMNLLSGWEEKPQMFWQVTGGIYGCIVLSIAGTVALCRRLSLL